jgi:glycosyltransferase involved in cell wall biosynthesis
MRPLKVLHLIGSMDLGGAEKLTSLTVEGLNSDEFKASVCCVKSGGFYADKLRTKGYQVDELLGVHKHASISLLMLLNAAWKLFNILRRERPDVLHSHLFAASCLGRVIGKLAGVPCIIVTLHRIEYPRIQPRIERLFKLLTSLFITDSNAAAAKLSCALKIPQKSIRVIYNGIDRSEFASPPSGEAARTSLNLKNDEFVIGVIAHLYKEKGHEFLLESLAMIKKRIPGFKLLIVGDGYLRKELEKQAEQMLPSGSVSFLGQRGDLANLLSAMDLFILPSSWEGFGIILAEAMYMRVPVITTSDGGGCAEVVKDNDGGQLVPYGDNAALSDAILRFYNDRSYRKDQGILGRARVERLFSSEAMIRQYADAYIGCKAVGH